MIDQLAARLFHRYRLEAVCGVRPATVRTLNKELAMRSSICILAVVLGCVAANIARADCLADPDWFKPAGPNAPNPNEPLPPGTEDCPFYKFAWQSFLYITYPGGQNNHPRFLDFTAPIDLFTGKETAKIRRPSRKKGTLNLLPRSVKTTTGATADDVIQSLSRGVIVDHSGRAIYYGTHLNDVFVTFIRDNGFDSDVKKIGSFAVDTPVTEGAIELKSAWKVYDPAIDNKSEFFTVDADVAPLKLQPDPSNPSQNIVVVDIQG